ncbi:DNA polymerase III subunit gamma/tau [Microbulbifer flavimaris]|uniref:DNA polymerase III subunit gamma/tau n=1 Tax=Microbulbifer flavimaris TaxID=1781068 RepID=A0ABX4I0D9_9GAMM|nr:MULTISPECIES: DNA polymerase III subunit gamma/tau [Microbulbifer]KUJ83358.1 DNA polymerase III subunit gamma/tau [Microbulbifer sp. ZGT114]PCO05513.1 DNA polymerase III subunit gamma/tau [Microbulbifer flavimaris]
MSYQVLARKWRPRLFREMVGQEHVLQALINALDNGRLHHAYLFAGTRGVGKTTIARILAKCLNCETGVSSEPCGQCAACTEIADGRFVDLIEVDAASRTKVEDTRELLENVQYAPTRGRYKVYLIDEVHMLSNSSFNALLKTLEEPPPHVKFLLATTDPQKLPVTVLSRCLQFNLKNMSPERVVEHLRFVLEQEMVPFEEGALWHLGRAADGSMRDAMSLTDQAIAFGGGKIAEAEVRSMLGSIDTGLVWKLLQALAEESATALFAAVTELAEQAPDYSAALAELANNLHRIAVAQVLPQSVDNTLGDGERLSHFAGQLAPENVQLYYQMALHARRDLPLAPDPRSGFEMALLRMLAFRPQGVADVPTSELPAPASATPPGEQPSAEQTAKKPLGEAQPADAGPVASATPPAEAPAAPGAPVSEQGLSAAPVDSAQPPVNSEPAALDKEPAAPTGHPAASAPSVTNAESAAIPPVTPDSPQPGGPESAGGQGSPESAPPADMAPAGYQETPAQAASPDTAPPWDVEGADDRQQAAAPGAADRHGTSAAGESASSVAVAPQPVAAAGIESASEEPSPPSPSAGAAVPEPAADERAALRALLREQVAAVESAPPAPEPAPQPAREAQPQGKSIPSARLESLTAGSWPALYGQLGVTGILHSIGFHLELVGRQDNILSFTLDESYSSLYDEVHQRRLADVLSDFFQQPVTVHIQVGQVHGGTPARLVAATREARAVAARDALSRDPLVRELQEELGAELVPESEEYLAETD